MPNAFEELAGVAEQRRAEGERNAPNNLERAIGEFIQDKPTLQRILASLGRAGSTVANVADAGVHAVKGDFDVAGDRLASAGSQAVDFLTDIPGALSRQVGLKIPNISDHSDFRSFGDVLTTAGVGDLGEADLPLIGRVTGKGFVGFLGDAFLDPLRVTRIGGLTEKGRAARAANRLAKAPVDIPTGTVGSVLGAQASAGQRALLSVGGRSVVTGAASLAALEKIARSVARVPGVRAFVKHRGVPGVARHVERGRLIGRELADDRTASISKFWEDVEAIAEKRGIDPEDVMSDFIQASEKKLSFQDKVADLQRRHDAAVRKGNSVAAEQLMEQIESLRKSGFTPAPLSPEASARIKDLTMGYIRQGYSRREAFRAARAASMLDIDADMAPFAVRFVDEMGDLLADEHEVGVAVRRLEDPALHYVQRVLTDEARLHLARTGKLRDFRVQVNRWLAKQGVPDARAPGRVASARHGSQVKRKAVFEGASIPELNRWLKKNMPEFEGKLFEERPAVIARRRSQRTGRAVTGATVMRGVMEDYARNVPAELIGAGWVSSDKVLRSAGLRPRSAPFEKFRGTAIPQEVADALVEYTSRTTGSASVSSLGRALDGSMRAFKSLVTVPFPAFHARNFLSNVWANFIAGVDSARYVDATRFMRDLRKGGAMTWTLSDGTVKTTTQLHRMMKNANIIGFGGASKADLVTSRALVSGRGALDRFERATNALSDNPVTRAGGRIGTAVEDHAKIAHFFDRMRKGDPIEDAILSVKKHLFDYGDLSPIEKTYLRRLVPFYTFARRNLPLQLETLVTKPGKAAALAHFQDFLQGRTDGRDDGPSAAIAPPWVQRRIFGLQRGEEGENPKLLSGIGIGFEELSIFDKPFTEFLAQLRPELKAIAQAGLDKDFFRDIPLSQSDRAPSIFRYFEFIPGGKAALDAIDFRPVQRDGQVAGYRANPSFLNFISGLPLVNATARVSNVASRGIDAAEGRTGDEFLTRFATGLRVEELDPRLQMANNMANLLEGWEARLEQLQAQGVTGRAGSRFFVRRDGLTSDDPRVVEARRLVRKLGQVRAARAQLRQSVLASRARGSLRSGGR